MNRLGFLCRGKFRTIVKLQSQLHGSMNIFVR
jgi:hypothetical protein